MRQFDAGDAAARADIMLSRLLLGVMERWPDRSDVVRYRNELGLVVDRPLARFGAWYEMFPRSQGTVPGQSATFDDRHRAPRRRFAPWASTWSICRRSIPSAVINRKGRDNSLAAAPGEPGSPYAIGAAEGGHRAVHPALGGRDGFRRFVAAARALEMEVALDFAIQCAPDHPWIAEHPEWFAFRPDGTIKYAENPPKKYQDIVNVEFYNRQAPALWRELRDVILFWVGEGVAIFRVDNPHTKPLPFWEWVIGEVQRRHPQVIFLAEAFTRPKLMRALAKVGFTQSYTYFTWRDHQGGAHGLLAPSSRKVRRRNISARTSSPTRPTSCRSICSRAAVPPFASAWCWRRRSRRATASITASSCARTTAIPGTEEYLHSEKYEFKVWDWDRPGHIKDDIARINRIRRDNASLQQLTNLRFHPCEQTIRCCSTARSSADGGNPVFIAVNLDPFAAHECEIELPLSEMRIPER